MMEDMRGQGAPGDIGTFLPPASVVVYKHTVSGTVYFVAARFGDRGWILVDHGTNPMTVINSALAASVGAVFVAAGDYTQAGDVTYTMTSNSYLQGESMERTILGSTDAASRVWCSGTTKVRISNLKLTRAVQAGTFGGEIQIDGASATIEVDHVHFSGSANYAIQAGAASPTTVSDLNIHHNLCDSSNITEFFFGQYFMAEISICNNTVSNTQLMAVYLRGSTDVTIACNKFIDAARGVGQNYLSVITLANNFAMTGVTISDNKFRWTTNPSGIVNGINVGGENNNSTYTDDVTIVANTFTVEAAVNTSYLTETAIACHGFDSTHHTVRNVVIASNTITAYGKLIRGMNVTLTDYASIIGNTIRHTDFTCMSIHDSDNCVCEGNNVADANNWSDLLTADALAGQKDVTVANGNVWLSTGQRVIIEDTLNSEYARSASKAGNVLTMATNLVHTYTVANGAHVHSFEDIIKQFDQCANMRCKNNAGFNPYGKIIGGNTPVVWYPFYNAPYFTIGLNPSGNASGPDPSQDYTVTGLDIIVSSTDSANANNAIVIKDQNGNQINPTALHTLDHMYLPVGWKINWGAYTGVKGTVVVCGI
jgi:hypothetical protein